MKKNITKNPAERHFQTEEAKEMKKNTNDIKLSPMDHRLLNQSIRVHDWHFKVLFTDKCILIERIIIGWKNMDPICIYVYGLQDVSEKTAKPCIANFFIKYGHMVFQAWYLHQIQEYVRVIKKMYKIRKEEEKRELTQSKNAS